MLTSTSRKIDTLPSGHVMVQDRDPKTNKELYVVLNTENKKIVYNAWENTVELNRSNPKNYFIRIYLKSLEEIRPEIQDPYVDFSLSHWLISLTFTKDWETISRGLNWITNPIPKITSDVALSNWESILRHIEQIEEKGGVEWDSFAIAVRGVLQPALDASFLARSILFKAMQNNKDCKARVDSLAIEVKKSEKMIELERSPDDITQ